MVFASIPDDYHLSLISGFCNYIIRKNNGMQVMVCKGPPLHKMVPLGADGGYLYLHAITYHAFLISIGYM